MPTYKAPVGDVMFLLSDVFHIDRYNNLPGFADATPDLVEAVLDEAAKFCEDVLTPLNRVGDKEGCKHDADGSLSGCDLVWLPTAVSRDICSAQSSSAWPRLPCGIALLGWCALYWHLFVVLARRTLSGSSVGR